MQDASDADSAWVHAYLHRKEGDLSNARYWYRRSGRSEFKETLEREWEQIVRDLLGKVGDFVGAQALRPDKIRLL